MITKTAALARGVAIVSLVVLANGATAQPSAAAGPRLLRLGDFGDQIQAKDVSGTPDGAVAGVSYRRAISLDTVGSYMALSTHKFPGYDAVSFSVGIEDTATPDISGTLVITGDGRTIKTISKRFGQSAQTVLIPFARYSTITFTADPNGQAIDDLLIGDPTLRPSESAPPAPGGALRLRVLYPTVTVGSQESFLVSTAPEASVTLVITGPTGKQQVLGPAYADGDGRLTKTWTVPAGLHGAAVVTAVGTSTAQASFIINDEQ